MSLPLIKVQDISKSFSGVKVLDKVSFTINSGEIHCLMGENGCGKSTIIKMISGVLVPDDGKITIGEKTYNQLRPIDAIREGVQVIYQDFSLFPNLTVAENIALNTQLAENRHLVYWKKVREIAKDTLEKIGAKIDLNSLVQNLSVANKQLVAICRALAQNARLIIMDEPTTALTELEIKSLFKIIKQLQAQGISVIFVSHKLNEVFEICDRITILRNGRNVAEGDVSSFTRESLVYHMTGREIENQPFTFNLKPEARKSLLKVENLCLRGTLADISFELFKGEIIGITGLLGSGRTELALALFGIKPAETGEVYIEGEQIRIRSIQDAINQGIAYVPEDRLTEGLFLTQSIGKNIVVGSIRRLRNKIGLTQPSQIKAQEAEWIKNLRVATPSAMLPVRSLSGGNQQRVVLAKWLAQNPRVLILNGPTVGVDVGSKSDIHAIMRELAEQGMGVIMISDDLPELLQNCNRLLVMRKGRVVEQVSTSEINENDLVRKLRGEIREVVL